MSSRLPPDQTNSGGTGTKLRDIWDTRTLGGKYDDIVSIRCRVELNGDNLTLCIPLVADGSVRKSERTTPDKHTQDR